MRNLLTFAAVVSASAPAFAGGLAEPAAEPTVMVAPSVTVATTRSWYAFGAVGAAAGSTDYTYELSTENNVTGIDFDGVTGTIGLGRDIYQLGSVAIAAELDLTAGNIESGIVLGTSTPCITDPTGCEASLDALATARLVAGWEAGRFKPFITAGLAAGNATGSADTGACGGDCSFDETLYGFAVGAGLNYALTERWSVRGNIMHVRLGAPEFPESDFDFAFEEEANVTSDDFSVNVFGVGASYRF